MSDLAIRVDGLGKRYRIGVQQPYRALRDTIGDALAWPVRALRRAGGGRVPAAGQASGEFWALKDVSFDVRPGEVVGLIGRNGAGKSTLLKVLSRITEPTTGMAEIRGRVGSLLEVGTGFHPELTGRENVFLNGAILGMRQAEIRRGFDEIVAFAGVEKFIDTPVKHYSSGMYLRLAFAVAAHLEPEILVVDEVLAVGDAEFQKRCLGKMGTVARSGRTVLFVSHNVAAVRALCSRAIVLQSGRVGLDTTDVPAAIAQYAGLMGSAVRWRRDPDGPPPSSPMVFEWLEYTLRGEQPNHVLELRGAVASIGPHPPAFLAFDVVDATSVPVLQAIPNASPFIHFSNDPQRFVVSIELPPLVPGTYHVHAWAGAHYQHRFDYVPSAFAFTIAASPVADRSFPHHPDNGHIVPPSTVTLEPAAEPTCAT